MKHVPTILTSFRIAMGPVIAALVLWAAEVTYIDRVVAGLIYALCAILFVLAAITDFLDGYIARKYDAVTPLGAALDHSADKVLVAAAVIILGRDIAVAGLREGISAQGKTLPVSELGKWKATAEMAGVGAFLVFQASALMLAPVTVVLGLDWAARILLWSAALLALISGAQYLRTLLKPAA
jgi:CDP-diacylglycerol--glycerol-3-phosphate 3-phosphatidyltransferase